MVATIERYELKFLIPFDWIARVEEYIQPYCALDAFSRVVPDGYYAVNTLYLDSPRYALLQNRLDDVPERFTLRVRAYGKGSEPPYFFEVKQKVGEFIRKSRGRWMENDWDRLLKDPPAEIADPQLSRFLNLTTLHQAEPKILTQYRRKAYFSMVDRYARLTFDRDLRRCETHEAILTVDDRSYSHYDHSMLFPPGCDVILEIKCLADVPLWILDLIRFLALQRHSFSKYASSVLNRSLCPEWMGQEPLSF